MLPLTADNAADYLRQRGWVGPGAVHITELADGVSNAVLRVEEPGRVTVLKQSRPQLRTREAWFSDLGRIWRERDVMVALRPLLPPGAVPEVLASDPENYAVLMSHAPEPFRNWRTTLLAGEVDPALGERAGELLGVLHEQTYLNWRFEKFHDRTVFRQLRVDPFYQRVRERRPEVAEQVDRLVASMEVFVFCLCHGDFSPKNLLLHAGGFTLVDYETAHFGDPTFDLGFFLSHLLLKAAHRPAERQLYFDLTRAFWRGYNGTGMKRFKPAEALMGHGIAHLGACLLARVDGTSPAPYLTDVAKREAVRRLGRGLLLELPAGWDGVLAMWEGVLAVCESEFAEIG
jgi:5-methylthioribose kinase